MESTKTNMQTFLAWWVSEKDLQCISLISVHNCIYLDSIDMYVSMFSSTLYVLLSYKPSNVYSVQPLTYFPHKWVAQGWREVPKIERFLHVTAIKT